MAYGDQVVMSTATATRPVALARPESTPAALAPRALDLRRRLTAIDACAVLAVVLLVGVVGAGSDASVPARLSVALLFAGVTMTTISGLGLYLARSCSIRSVELVGLARAVGVGTLAGYLVTRMLATPMPGELALAAVLTFSALAGGRGAYSGWLRRARARGEHCRQVVVVGAEAEAGRLVWLLRRHPELGLRPVGVMGRGAAVGTTLEGVACLGDLDDVATTIAGVGANGVVIASGDLDSDELNALVRTLLAARIHVQLSSGLWGVDHSRLRPVPLAHEPFMYLEPMGLRRGQRVGKRVLDVTVSGLLLLLAAPVIGIAALAVWLQDGASPIFRQVRVGKRDERFTLFKLRTMVPDAERQLVDVTSVNQRAGGPLFKATSDPRRTRVGRILERTSLDELPQLLNVLKGDMSLVGPRPALPHEVSEFDEELRGRHRVRPGITGLWQVEARDKPDFEIYRRLDLFYVDNWSIGLDVAIMFGTLCSVARRVVPNRA
jgi:exopolysaccharide biosynthesis polyprenyl glycosylphosphotransferase